MSSQIIPRHAHRGGWDLGNEVLVLAEALDLALLGVKLPTSPTGTFSLMLAMVSPMILAIVAVIESLSLPAVSV
jgi:hypothetical protein